MKHCVVGMLFILTASVSAGSSRFRFEVPEGWTDLSPGAPASAFAGLPQSVFDEATSGKYAAFAMDMREEDGFYENFNAVVDAAALNVSEDFLALQARSLPEQYTRAMGVPVELVEKEIVSVRGVPAIRYVVDIKNPALVLRQMQYFVPGGDDGYAVITYTAALEKFAAYRSTFETAAMATGGVAEPSTLFVRMMKRGTNGAMWGGLIGAVIGILVYGWKKAEASKAPPSRRRPAPQMHVATRRKGRTAR